MDYNFALFNAITDALFLLNEAKEILIAAQDKAEEAYIEQEENL